MVGLSDLVSPTAWHKGLACSLGAISSQSSQANYRTCKYCNVSTHYLPQGGIVKKQTEMESSTQHVYLGVDLGKTPVEGIGGRQNLAQEKVQLKFDQL